VAAKLHPFAVYGLLKEMRGAAEDRVGPLVVSGPDGLASVLARELGRDADPGAVRVGLDGAAAALVLVHVLAAPAGPDDERVLAEARRRRVPAIGVLAGPELEPRVPHLLATDLVRVPAGAGFPVNEIARAVARKLDQDAARLAARLPALRAAVRDELVESFARRNAVVGAAVFVGGADFPILTLNQVRLVLLLAVAYGVDVDEQRLPEVLGVIAGGFGLRALARRLLVTLPLPAFALKAGLAYAGTRAIGAAAARYFELRAGASRR
jgi:uncharacterized protein (DUF697 family)